MALVCDELKFIYFLAPGTGSSSLYQYFIDNFQVERLPDSDENIMSEDGKIVVKSKHSTFKELKEHNLLNSDRLEYLRITGTRNPYDYFYAEWYRSRTRFSKLLSDESSWIYRTPKGRKRIAEIVDSIILDFPDWLEKRLDTKYKSGQTAVLHPQYIHQADAFIRMENMNEDIHNILLEHCQLDKKIDVPKKNVTNRDRCYWQHYNLSARNIVSTIFKPYLNKFDYSF
jgi:hypothetical protein